MGETRKIGGSLVTVALFAVVAAAVLVVLFWLSGSLSLGGRYEVKAVVPQAGTLTEGTSVTMAGARVGTVTGVHRRGVGALVDIRIENDEVLPLAKDSKAQLAVRTPLGENYVEIVPGSSKEKLAKGDIIPPARDTEYVDVDEILSVLNGETRDRARDVIQGLGKAVDERGNQLNATLSSAASLLQAGSGLTQRIEDDREQIAQLVEQLGDLGVAIGERGESIRQVAVHGRTTFQAVADRDSRVREILDVLPSTLRAVRRTTTTVKDTSETATPVVADLAVALREAQPAIRNLRPAASAGRGIVSSLAVAAPRLRTTLSTLRAAAPDLAKTLPELEKVFCQANPSLRYIQPYIRDILSFAIGLGAAANSYDAVGHTIRLLPVFSENAALGAPPEVREAAFDLVRKGFFSESLGLGFEPFPKPGQAEVTFGPGTPSRIGPKDVLKSGFKYPRIQKDC